MFIAINFGKLGFGFTSNPVEKTVRLGFVSVSVFKGTIWGAFQSIATGVAKMLSAGNHGCHGCHTGTPTQAPEESAE